MRGYRGVGGYFRRERDEPAGPRTEYARTPGQCAQTGAPIKVGDLIQRDRVTWRTILVKKT